MPTDRRPDPDALLAAIKKDESVASSGKLRIFFGMAAGVGKTFAMLRAAQDRLKEGVDIVVGLVETHRRAETEELLSGLQIIPRRVNVYRDIELREMDIDAIIARKPQLVLVDELAHTNIPGSRHPKRWQDVQEILEAGIDVYTTLNVQHLESRKEYIEQITGIVIRETVPDTILEQASQITLIDISPAELLQRLKEGKVYLGERAEAAAQNFFKEDRLTALREISLRITAEAVGDELDDLSEIGELATRWKTAERLMVALSHSPHSEDLIRATRRLAFSMDAPWYGVHVNTGAVLSEDDRARLSRNLALVKELGGEVVSVTDVDVVEALIHVAETRSITQLIVGRPVKRSIRDFIARGTLLDRLARRSTSFDIHVLKPSRSAGSASRNKLRLSTESTLEQYWFMVWVTLAAAIVGTFATPFIGYRAVGFLFLLAVLSVGLFVSIGPTIFAALLAAVTWNYFFIPPRFTFNISQPEDVAMCLALFVTALVTGVLTNRIRQRERLLRQREQQTAILYDVVKTIAATNDRRKFSAAVAGGLEVLLHGKLGVILKNVDGILEHVDSGSSVVWLTSEKEWIVAMWSFEHRKEAGWSTDTLASADAWYIPLVGPTEAVGVLAYKSDPNTRLSQDESELLRLVARQLAVAAERELFQDRSAVSEKLAESERLYQTMLNSVSHEIRTPLTAIMGTASALQSEQISSDKNVRRLLVNELLGNAGRMNRVVSNLLDMSRLNSGHMRLKLDWHEVGDLIGVVLESNRDALSNQNVISMISPNLPLVRIDFALMEQVLSNLLINASMYTPSGTQIEIDARSVDEIVLISVSDNGPGIPAECIPHVFEKFYRVPGTSAGGTGIGLAIAKGIMEAHKGTISVENRHEGGVRFALRLPIEPQPRYPSEAGG